MMNLLQKIYDKIYFFRHRAAGLEVKVVALEQELNKWKTNFQPPGHYYSPYPDSLQLEKQKNLIFKKNANTSLPGIELNTDAQFLLLAQLAKFYSPEIFPFQKSAGYRYYFDNQYFCFSDALFLACTMQQVRPKKIIEIGSGFSSAVMLDINEKNFNNSIQLTFIEPFPEDRLNALVTTTDNCTIIKDFVQNLPLDLFMQLEEDDILFIDSSHISKTYSDVNHLLFNIIPRLKKGVIIHIHDVFFPFEYPAEWIIEQQRAWNEAYLLRAFLQFNDTFSVLLFTSYLETKFRDWFTVHMPLCLEKHEKWPRPDGTFYLLETGGQSLYLRKEK